MKIRAYSKSELALMYGVSVQTLNKWIERMPDNLEEMGYSSLDKIFTAKMVRAIVSHLGCPD